MARILITHSYHLALDPREQALGKPYPPLGTMVVAAQVRAAGHDVVFYDPMFESSEATFASQRGDFDAVAIVADDHSVQQKQCLARMREAALSMAKEASRWGAEVIVSGPEVSDRPDRYLESGADAAVVGEPCGAVLSWLSGASDVLGVHGLRGGGGRRPLVEDLDSLPLPAWDLVDLGAYARHWRQRHGYWEMNVWTARGCPYRCNWCSKPVWGRSYHVRAAAEVAAEIAQLRERYAPDRIWFTDDIFALRKDWLEDFRAALDQPVPFRCLSRADLLEDPRYARTLAQAGCLEVWMGAESGSDAVLKAMDKDCTVDQIRAAVNQLRQHGVRACLFLQLGYPGETLEDVLATVRMVRELVPDEIGVSVSYPLPGTGFFEQVAGSMSQTNWDASMDNKPLFEAPYTGDFYGAAKEVLRSTHSARGGPAALRAFVRRPGRRTGRKVAGAAWHVLRLPWAHGRMRRLAVDNPDAVPLTW